MNNLRKQIVLILGIAFLLFSFVQLEAQENKKAEKAGIKVKKSAANMEKVEIKESVKAYNKLVDQFNKIENDNKSTDAADQINQHIDSTTDEIASILSSVCKQNKIIQAAMKENIENNLPERESHQKLRMIQKGIKNGQKIMLAGQGNPGYNGGEQGEMYIKVEFDTHRTNEVKGADIYIQLPLATWEAALGTKVDVPTPTGNIKLNISAGSAQGKKIRLKGKGIPSKNPGDLYAVINIVLPPADDDESRKVY